MPSSPRSALALCAALTIGLSLLCLCRPASARGPKPATPDKAVANDNTPGLPLPAGESVIALGWDSPTSVVLLCRGRDGFALHRSSIGSPRLDDIVPDRAFAALAPGKQGADPDFWLAPNGKALAALRPAAEPLRERELLIWHIQGSAIDEQSKRLPPDFWPQHAAWNADGSQLYLAQRNYINPDQEFSLGAIDMQSGKFSGVALRGNVDLIDDLRYLSGRKALVLRARGFHGEYPLQSMLVLLDLESMQLSLLHTEASQLALNPLGDGRLLAWYDESLPVSPDAPSSREGRSDWQLPAGGIELQPAALSLDKAAGSLRVSSDGVWMGFVAKARELGVEASAKEPPVLVLQRPVDGRSVLTETPCELFAFSPDSRKVCAVASQGSRVFYFELPVD